MALPKLSGIAEAAEVLGWSKSTFIRFRKEEALPKSLLPLPEPA